MGTAEVQKESAPPGEHKQMLQSSTRFSIVLKVELSTEGSSGEVVVSESEGGERPDYTSSAAHRIEYRISGNLHSSLYRSQRLSPSMQRIDTG